MRFHLPNGLSVIVEESRAAPVVAMQVWVGVGSIDERAGEIGIAHVFEHMLFKGTARRGVGEIAREVERAGGDINAWTSYEETVFHLVMAARDFEVGLDILADAVAHSAFDPIELERERQVVLEEIKQGADVPARALTQALFHTAFGGHPYGRPVIGSAQSVSGLSRAQLVRFFRRWYVPANMTLVIVGDVAAERAARATRRLWGAIPGKARRSTRPIPPVPAQRTARAVVLARPSIETHVAVAFRIPGIRSDDSGALDLAAVILGHGEASRLALHVKRDQQLATDVYAYTYTPRHSGVLVAGGTTRGDPEALVRGLLGEVMRLGTGPGSSPITDDELRRARTIIESEGVYQKETVQGLARKLGFYATVAGGLEFEREYLRQVAAADADHVRATLARYAVPSGVTVSALVPDTSKPAVLRGLRGRLLTAAREVTKVPRAARKTSSAPGEIIAFPLAGGARLLVRRDPAVGLVAMRAAWPGGLRYETPETCGSTQLLATLLGRGTRARDAATISRDIEAMAGSLSGVPGRNSLGLRAEMLARRWDTGMSLFLDCLLEPQFPAEELDKERRVLLAEIEAQKDDLAGMTFRLLTGTLYRAHPYRLDPLGTAESVASLGAPVLRRLFARCYPTSRLVVAVIGDIDPEAVHEAMAPRFAAAASGRTARAGGVADPPSEPTSAPGTRWVHRALERQQSHLVVGFPGTTLYDPDRHALEVLFTVLSGQGGRLFVELRDRRSLAYRVGAFSVEGLDPGYLAAYIACSPERVDAALGGIRAELDRVCAEPISAAELHRARRYLVGNHDVSLQRRAALAATVALNECYGLGWDTYRRYAESIAAVDEAAVLRAARRYLDWQRAVVASVGPAAPKP